jgi:hypothetical protein
VAVEDQRQPQAEHEFSDRGDDRVEERVEHRQPEHAVVPQILEILQADEDAGAADHGVGHRQPEAESERIGEEQAEHRRRRQQKNQADEVAVRRKTPPARAAARTGQGDAFAPDRHAGCFLAGRRRAPR